MWVSKKKWFEIKKEIDELKKEQLSLNKNIKESIESNKQLIFIVKQLRIDLERSTDAYNAKHNSIL